MGVIIPNITPELPPSRGSYDLNDPRVGGNIWPFSKDWVLASFGKKLGLSFFGQNFRQILAVNTNTGVT